MATFLAFILSEKYLFVGKSIIYIKSRISLFVQVIQQNGNLEELVRIHGNFGNKILKQNTYYEFYNCYICNLILQLTRAKSFS